MKRILTLLMISGQAMVALAQDNGQKPYQTKSLAGDDISSVIVNTSAGSITVIGENGGNPRVEVYVNGNKDNHELSKEEIQNRLDKYYDLDVTVTGHEVKATAKNKNLSGEMDWSKGLSISFKVYVPVSVSTDLHTSGGGIVMDNLSGSEEFSTSGGGLALNKLSGKIKGHTSGGGIALSNSSDDIDLTTSGGAITAKDCSGKISLGTSGGGLDLENLKGTISAHTSGGGIRGNNIEGELLAHTSGGGINLKGMSCSLEAQTSAGSMTIEMAHVGKYLKLNTSAGNLNLHLPASQGYDLNLSADRINNQAAANFKGTWDERNVNGSINGGGIPVEAHASSRINVSLN
jgi:DUF4097 and DUF4098 domain-containing protein YvlB